ncbi:MAG: hypothetical protein COW55_10030 [Rhodobacteraceae bacterium CG17_big_fil_post_rev_8_21_14_2_50_65_11]|nr:MAG: hypothetical protein COW55_10030 [Rhodobacteraceae bacterium CG17_big_fil_post_rev_8_21_14_2_50_65_11]
MRIIAMAGFVLLVLGGCAVQPEDTRGVGFGDYNDRLAGERAQRRTALAAAEETVLPPARQTGQTDIAALAEGAIDAAEGQARRDQADGGQADAVAAPLRRGNTSGISDEQDFEAVAGRETIESDAERLERMQAQRVEIAPTVVPERAGATGPNIIEYALVTSHPVGEQRHNRLNFAAGARHERNCRAYRSDDLAQEAFLAAGGPERDRQALDPDGDGYACGWDPTPYREAAAAARGQ